MASQNESQDITRLELPHAGGLTPSRSRSDTEEAHTPPDTPDTPTVLSNQFLPHVEEAFRRARMADRFPALDEEPDKSIRTSRSASAAPADFLTRERDALGDDADLFATINDDPSLANIDSSQTPGGSRSSAAVQDDDLLGGDFGGEGARDEQIMDFENSFPTVDSRNERVAPGGSITGPNQVNQRQPSYVVNGQGEEEETEPMRKWRESRDLDLRRRDETSAAKKADKTEQARKDIDEFYENYNHKKDKSIGKTRKEAEEFLDSREDTSAGGTSWERIGKLVDVSGKGAKGGASGTEKQKFRELLVDLKKDEKAPGAKGY